MQTLGEWSDKVNEITDALEHAANKKLVEEVQKANAYRDGYIQACEDFGREMRRLLRGEQI